MGARYALARPNTSICAPSSSTGCFRTVKPNGSMSLVARRPGTVATSEVLCRIYPALTKCGMLERTNQSSHAFWINPSNFPCPVLAGAMTKYFAFRQSVICNAERSRVWRRRNRRRPGSAFGRSEPLPIGSVHGCLRSVSCALKSGVHLERMILKAVISVNGTSVI
jgi:hypothetical protein